MTSQLSVVSTLIVSMLVLVVSPAHGAQAASGSALAGCITESISGQPLPGVTIDVSRGGVHRSVVSDAAGCYEISGLSTGTHVVFARLRGFASFVRDELPIVPNIVFRLDFQMAIPPICECIVYPTLALLWRDAEAVVRVSVVGHEPGLMAAASYVTHTAAVVTVFKRHPQAAAAKLTFVQEPSGDEIEPYAIGQEFVLFLRWNPMRRAFERVNGMSGGFAIENGRLHSAGVAGYAGKNVEDFVEELRALSRK